MSLGAEQEYFTRDLVKLLSKAFELGYEVRMGEVQRMMEMQEIYVKTGRSKTLNSQHLKKLAADLHFVKNGAIVYPQELGDYWESLARVNRWGGNWKSFKDKPHFERFV
jgi:peptidoglycan L-alanyl-D-glutamate endopeptidase CwlK